MVFQVCSDRASDPVPSDVSLTGSMLRSRKGGRAVYSTRRLRVGPHCQACNIRGCHISRKGIL